MDALVTTLREACLCGVMWEVETDVGWPRGWGPECWSKPLFLSSFHIPRSHHPSVLPSRSRWMDHWDVSMSVQAVCAEGWTLLLWVPIVEHLEPGGSRDCVTYLPY